MSGLPSDTMASPNNDSHIKAIVTKSGRTLHNDVVNLDNKPNNRGG